MQEVARRNFASGSFIRMFFQRQVIDKTREFFLFSHWTECDDFHKTKDCDCDMTITGIHELTDGYQYTSLCYDHGVRYSRNQRIHRMLEDLADKFCYGIDGRPIARIRGDWMSEIHRRLHLSPNCAVIPGPFRYKSLPEAEIMPARTREVHNILYQADVLYFERLEMSFGGYRIRPFVNVDVHAGLMRYMDSSTQIKSLTQLAFEAASPYVMASRKLAMSSSANLYDKGGTKMLDIFTTYCKPIRGLKKEAERLIPLFPEAIEIVTHLCRSESEIGQHEPNLDLEDIVRSMNLSSAGGINSSADPVKSTDPYTGLDSINNPNGKKFEVLEASMRRVVEFFTKGIRPVTTFKMSYKRENAFVDRECDFDRKSAKGRIFVIPNLETILMEQMIGITRKLELGGAIGIGRTWSRGGMDALLKMMGVLYDYAEYDLNEGDIKKIDQSLADVLINIFFASRIQYFRKGSPGYPYARKIIQYLIEEFSQKITHIVGEMWATVCGGVPSGALHTSHMDSWILLFLFVLFCLDMRQKFPEHQEAIMRSLLLRCLIVVYGDDNWYWTQRGIMTSILNAHRWSEWLKLHWDIEMQDIRVGHPLVSEPQGGGLRIRGGVYLRHYCVRNPVSGDGQPIFVPYRPMQEIVLKVAHGREPNVRTPVSLLLSVLGHTYGTYGSNEFTYTWLFAVYTAILRTTNQDHATLMASLPHEEKEVLRKVRQIGISDEQLREGFPTLRTLRAMNKYDPNAHGIGAMSLRAMEV